MDRLPKLWENVSKFAQANPVIQAISEHHKKIIPVLVVGVLGTTVYFAWYNRSKVKKLRKHKRKGEKDFQLDVSELPPEVRKVIWSKLADEDLLKLRQVSTLTKEDVDLSVGLKMFISTKNMEKYEFAQKVALQSCTITHLTLDIDPNFFVDPFLMKEIEFIEKSPVTLTNIKNVLTPCTNLKMLKLRLIHCAQVTEVSEIVLHAMENMQDLTSLQLMRMAAHPIQEKLFPLDSTGLSFSCPKNLQYVEIEIPDVGNDQVNAWKYLLEQQTNLKELSLNLGAIHWQFFQKIIANNPNLEQLGLFGIKSFPMDSEQEIPLDWGIFLNCLKLKIFELTCPRTSEPHGVESMRGVQFDLFPTKNIEEFHVSRVIMSAQDVQKVYREMPKLKRGTLDHIGDAGTARAEELSWVFQQQQEVQRQDWFTRERFWDAVVHSIIGVSLLSVVLLASQTHQQFTAPRGPV